MSALPSLQNADAGQERPADELLQRLGLAPDSPGGRLVTLAVLAIQGNLWQQAIIALQQACAFHPENADLLLELGYIYQHRCALELALDTYSRVIALRPTWAALYANLGSLLVVMERYELAAQASRIGISLDPDIPGLYINLASALRSAKRPDEAWTAYQDLLARFPFHAPGLTDSMHLRQHLNIWDGFDEHLALVRERTYRLDQPVPPFSIIAAIVDPTEHLKAAQAWVAHLNPNAAAPLAVYGPRIADRRNRRIRVGYVSNDFHNHATALLMIGLLEARDRNRFEVIGYSTGDIDDGTLIRRRILSAFDICYDIKTVSAIDAARKIRDDEIDVLIDLKGFTQGARPEIMSYRPAPIQVNYLGYPGTMGATFIDYILADPYVIPRDREADFDEKVARLPECYQPNDGDRRVWPQPYTREQCGLPEGAFVFCSFNAPYKITPAMFDIWMRLLHRLPGSVLWLLGGYETGNANLKRETARRGIDPDRVIIAPKMVTEQHLSRLRLGDLFLDSFPVTAHTTASDALWMSVPVLTCPGESFVSRVAASLLHAIGLPDLIASDFADYEDKAVALATDPAALADVQARLEANRLTTPLFDSERYTRHYEAALATMVERMDAGQPVASFDVPPRPRG